MASSRRIYGDWKNNPPSRFLNEIPSNCLKITNQISSCYNGSSNFYGSSSYKKSSSGYGGYYNRKPKFSTKPSYQKYEENEHEYSYEPADGYAPENKKTLIGVRVYHENFGYGKIVSVSGQMCLVDFDDYGTKKVMGSYLRRA